MEQDVIEYQQVSANGKPITKKMPGVKKAGEITVTRGMTSQPRSPSGSTRLAARRRWAPPGKNATIIDHGLPDNPVRRYHLRNAWCSKVEGPAAKAGEASVLHRDRHDRLRRAGHRVMRRGTAAQAWPTPLPAARPLRAGRGGPGRRPARHSAPARQRAAHRVRVRAAARLRGRDGHRAPRRRRCAWRPPGTS